VAQLEADKTKKTQELTKAEADLQSLILFNKTLEASETNLQARVQHLEGEYEKAQKEYEKAQGEHEKAQIDHENAKKEVVGLKLSLQSKDGIIRDMKANLEKSALELGKHL